ncbi:MAG: hypothetical protein WAL45_05525 [Terracidiphilus sp.]
MRPDRPLIGAVVSLAAGIAAILAYCHGTTAFNASYPFSACQLHIDFTTDGPAVLGGMALIALGLLLMAWALLAAIASQIVRLFARDDEMESIIGRSRAPHLDAENYHGAITMTEHKHET